MPKMDGPEEARKFDKFLDDLMKVSPIKDNAQEYLKFLYMAKLSLSLIEFRVHARNFHLPDKGKGSTLLEFKTEEVEDAIPVAVTQLKDSMLEVISEKTGWPVDMLELDMDMTEDLGIDSIKKVEILGAMMDRHPELPEWPDMGPDELAEFRTLKQVVEHMECTLRGMGQ